ncbi:hypothetical protein QTP88_017951 [Uroleucon formosanum]
MNFFRYDPSYNTLFVNNKYDERSTIVFFKRLFKKKSNNYKGQNVNKSIKSSEELSPYSCIWQIV